MKRSVLLAGMFGTVLLLSFGCLPSTININAHIDINVKVDKELDTVFADLDNQ